MRQFRNTEFYLKEQYLRLGLLSHLLFFHIMLIIWDHFYTLQLRFLHTAPLSKMYWKNRHLKYSLCWLSPYQSALLLKILHVWDVIIVALTVADGANVATYQIRCCRNSSGRQLYIHICWWGEQQPMGKLHHLNQPMIYYHNNDNTITQSIIQGQTFVFVVLVQMFNNALWNITNLK